MRVTAATAWIALPLRTQSRRRTARTSPPAAPLAIDHKGIIGDPGYEVATSFFNPLPRIPEVPNLEQMLARRVAQLSEELGMERARIHGWGLAQNVRNAWSMVAHNQLSMNPQGVLRCAEILSRLTV